jgi:hypothetical protein
MQQSSRNGQNGSTPVRTSPIFAAFLFEASNSTERPKDNPIFLHCTIATIP